MRKVPFTLSLALMALVCLTTAANAGVFTQTMDKVVPNAVVVTYDPASGNLSYDGNGKEITTMELKSAGGLFIPDKINDGIITGPFDVLNAGKFFTLTTAPNQVSSVDMGPIVPAKLDAAAIIADMAVGGSLYPKGGLNTAEGGGPYLYVVPEPSSIALVCCGLLGLLGLRRK